MYYLYDDSGALIDEYELEQRELALLNKDTFSGSILLYYGEGAKRFKKDYRCFIRRKYKKDLNE